jgi:SAM-dependent methyltransferase
MALVAAGGKGLNAGRGVLSFRNTYLAGSRRLFALIVSDNRYDSVLAAQNTAGMKKQKSLLRRIGQRGRLWFWPNISDAEEWALSTEERGWKPSTYLSTEDRRLLKYLLETVDRDQSVLDLGCNSGAVLNSLYRAGFNSLYGVDAGRSALELFAQEFPEAYAVAEVKRDLFQRYLLTLPSRFVDVVHSNGATLELVHPSFPLVKEICRVTRSRVYLDIAERGHSYPRFYISQFERNGFRLSHCERPADLVQGNSLLRFDRC